MLLRLVGLMELFLSFSLSDFQGRGLCGDDFSLKIKTKQTEQANFNIGVRLDIYGPNCFKLGIVIELTKVCTFDTILNDPSSSAFDVMTVLNPQAGGC